MRNERIIIDIETISSNDCELFKPEFQADKRLTNEDKIKEDLLKKETEWLEKTPLDYLTGQVALIGVNDDNYVNMYQADSIDEYNILDCFWNSNYSEWIKNGNLIIGFNIKRFDLPYLYMRALKYGIKPQWKFNDRYNTQIIDLMELFEQGLYDKKFKYSLDKVLQYFGLEKKLDTGKNFGELWKTDKDKAIAYNKDEIEKLVKLADIML